MQLQTPSTVSMCRPCASSQVPSPLLFSSSFSCAFTSLLFQDFSLSSNDAPIFDETTVQSNIMQFASSSPYMVFSQPYFTLTFLGAGMVEAPGRITILSHVKRSIILAGTESGQVAVYEGTPLRAGGLVRLCLLLLTFSFPAHLLSSP